MSNGNVNLSANRTVLLSPSKEDTSIRRDPEQFQLIYQMIYANVPDSIMYKVLVIQSTATALG